MSKARILVVSHYFSTHRGGVEIVAGKLVEGLALRGYAMTWAASDTDPLPSDVPDAELMPIAAMNAFEQRLGVPYPLWFKGAGAALREKIRNSDLVHIHDCLYHGNILVAREAFRVGVPCMVTQHIGFVPYRSAALRHALTLANRHIGLTTLSKARAVAFVSETTRTHFQSIGLPLDVGRLIPNGVDLDVYTPDGDSARAPLGLPEDRPVFLFVGRFVEKKGLLVIRQLAERMPQVQWALAGWGPIRPEDWNMPNVKVFSDLSGPSLAPLYRAADLLVLPSVGEGFPLVVQEAIACGTPVLVSHETASGFPLAKYILHSPASDDEEDWLQECLLKANEFDRSKPKSQELAEFARNQWSWTRCLDRYEALIGTAVKGGA